jgi:GMP synthase (glutamine-hydrolysing)
VKSAVAIRHVHFEDLGTLAPILSGAGYQVTYLDVGTDNLKTLDPLRHDLLVVLGAPLEFTKAKHTPFFSRNVSCWLRVCARTCQRLGSASAASR